MKNDIYVLTETLVANNHDLIYQKTFVFNGYTDALNDKIKDLVDTQILSVDYELEINVDDNPQWNPLLEADDPTDISELPIKVITIRNSSYDDAPVYHATLTKTTLN